MMEPPNNEMELTKSAPARNRGPRSSSQCWVARQEERGTAAEALRPRRAHPSARSLCEEPAADRQEPAAHENQPQLGYRRLLRACEAEIASLFREAFAHCRNQSQAEGVADRS